MALNDFSTLQFVPTAPNKLTEIRTATLYKAFCPLIFPIGVFTQCHLKYVSVSMIGHSWLSHFIIFQMRKGNELTDQKFLLSFVRLFSIFFLLSYFQSKNDAILEPRKEHILVLVGFEAKEGRPLGQGCPGVLHLRHLKWYIIACKIKIQ